MLIWSVRGLRRVMTDRGDRGCVLLHEINGQIQHLTLNRWKWLIPSKFINYLTFSFSFSQWKDNITTTTRPRGVSKPGSLHTGILTPQNESRRAQSWDQVGHPCQRRPRHPTQGTTQVQAEADPSVQEQAPEEGNPGVCLQWCIAFSRGLEINASSGL